MLSRADSYAQLASQFQWQVPAAYNIGVDACDKWADGSGRLALIYEKSDGAQTRYTFDEIKAQSNRLARSLERHGVKRGDRVAVYLPQAPETAVTHIAVYKMGAVAVPLFTLFGVDAIQYRLANSGAAALVTDAAGCRKLREIRASLPDLKVVYCIDDEPVDDAVPFHAALAAEADEYAPVATAADDPAVIIYTSGTTGKPKGVVLTHHALIDRARAVSELEKLTDQEDVLAYLPPAWIGQNMFSYTQLLVTGFTVNHPESPDTVSIDMRDIGPTYYFAPPRVLEGLLTHVMIRMEDAGFIKRKLFASCMKLARRVGTRILDGESVNAWDRLRYALGNALIYGPLRNALGMSRVRVAYTAGEAIGPDLFVFYRSIGINLKQLYGSTETSVFVCVQPDGQVRDDTVGPPVDGVEIRVAENGEILVKSPGLFKEYYRNPEATAEARSADGWFHTGDAGYLDTDGQLKIIDRAKDVGKLANGSLFAPKYIENKLKFFQHIKEAVAFGADRDDVCAFINIDLEAVGNWAERRGMPYAGYTDLASKDEVYQLIAECVEQVNADLATDPKLSASQISRFLILHKELDPDDDELTRTRKVRRAFIAQKYGVLIDALYSGKPSQFIETEVKFEDGRTGKISADLKIRPVKTFPAITARAA